MESQSSRWWSVLRRCARRKGSSKISNVKATTKSPQNAAAAGCGSLVRNYRKLFLTRELRLIQPLEYFLYGVKSLPEYIRYDLMGGGSEYCEFKSWGKRLNSEIFSYKRAGGKSLRRFFRGRFVGILARYGFVSREANRSKCLNYKDLSDFGRSWLWTFLRWMAGNGL